MPEETGTPSTRDALRAAIDGLPRVELARLPTPLERLPRLGAAWGLPDLWIKRDDLSGLAFGGNKGRKLEFLVAHAQHKGARTLVTGGRTQSNHTRDTAVAAKRVGLAAEVVLAGTRPDPPTANVLLTERMGVPITWAGSDGDAMRKGLRMMAGLKLAGKRPYFIPAGAGNARGSVGYVHAVLELVEQCRAAGESLPDTIVLAAGSGGTLAGLLAGFRLLGLPTRVIGVCAAEAPWGRPVRVAKLAAATCALLGYKKARFGPGDVRVEEDYLGEGYARSTPLSEAALTTLAQYEGIFLDPVYTGKALAGLHGLVAQGEIASGERILFWHTGGTVALFR